MKKNLVSIQVIIARVGDRIDINMTGESQDLNNFGMDAEMFHNLGIKIDKAVREIIK